MYKTAIIPIFALLKLVLDAMGIHIPEEVINDAANTTANFIAIGAIIYGIIKNHNKDKRQGDK